MAFVEHRNYLALTWLIVINCMPASLQAHGGVVLEDDLCLIKVGFYRAHFTLFQPRSRGHQQFCEDLPELGESIFVLEYLHDGLEQLAVDLRVIHNVTGAGQFARAEDVDALPDLQAVTVFYHPAVTDPDAFTALYDFTRSGEYIGIVTATDTASNAIYTAVFPFEVAVSGFGNSAVSGMLVVTVTLLFALAWRQWRKPGKRFSISNYGLLCCLCLAAGLPRWAQAEPLHSTGDRLTVFITPSLQPMQINRMHQWQVRIVDHNNQPVTGAKLQVSGGMPKHDHGLPSAPRLTRELTPGTYLVEGMKFHMHGVWHIQLQVTAAQISDSLQVEVEL